MEHVEYCDGTLFLSLLARVSNGQAYYGIPCLYTKEKSHDIDFPAHLIAHTYIQSQFDPSEDNLIIIECVIIIAGLEK